MSCYCPAKCGREIRGANVTDMAATLVGHWVAKHPDLPTLTYIEAAEAIEKQIKAQINEQRDAAPRKPQMPSTKPQS